MTATQTTPGAKPGRRRRGRLILIGVGIMVAALAVGVLAGTLITNKPTDPTAAAPVTSAAPSTNAGSTTAATSSPASTANQANGCLGGSDPFAAIVPAQQAASLDSAGAAAFARTYMRWLSAYPIDPNASDVLARITTSDSAYGTKTLDQLNETARALQVQDYTESRVLSDSGGYRFISRGNTEGATLDVLTERQLTRNDGRVETQKNVARLVLRADSGQWHIVGTLPQTEDDPYANLADNPWQSYAGAC